jgi:3-dehydroquinate dehydratase-1
MDSFPKVVASVASLDDAGEAVRLGADMIEVRVDLASEDPQILLEKVFRLGKPIIVTIRPTWEGGSFRGDDAERLELFRKLIPMAGYIDVELRARNADDIISLTEGSGVMAIVSYHDFEKTPSRGEMLDIISRCLEKGDVAKLAVMPAGLGDVLRLLEVTLSSRRPVCTMAMGDIGAHSRIVAPVYGSAFSYGHAGKPLAPGQMRVDKIIEGLRLLGLR